NVIRTLKLIDPGVSVKDCLEALEHNFGSVEGPEDSYSAASDVLMCRNEENPSLVYGKLRISWERSGSCQRVWGRGPPRSAGFEDSPRKDCPAGIPAGLIGPRAEVMVRIEGVECKAVLDTGSQVTIIFQSFYQQMLRHLPIQPLTGLGLCGLSMDEYPYQGYVIVHLEFPEEVAGVREEVDTAALICPDPKGTSDVSVLIGTNSSLFKVLADYCRRRAGDQYLNTLMIHTLCAEAYRKIESAKRDTSELPLGALKYAGTTPLERSIKLCERSKWKVVGDMNLLQVLVYLDDLIVFGRTLEEHEERLLKVLDRLEDYGLKLSIDKCQFCRTSVKYVGHIVSQEGVRNQ
ncbi:unnamed protein product, partial [Eretmochelys imbricata]